MKANMEIIFTRLGEKEKMKLMELPDEVLAPLKNGMQAVESNIALQDAIIKKIEQMIVKNPTHLTSTIRKINSFLDAAKEKKALYMCSPDIVKDFNEKLRLPTKKAKRSSSTSADQNNTNGNTPTNTEAADAQNIEKIMPQLLFRSFFAMLSPNRRKQLIKFIDENKHGDPELIRELNGRMNDKIVDNEAAQEVLMEQIDKGRLDSFRWLHKTLFNYFNKIMEHEDREIELKQQLATEKKKQPPLPEAPTTPSSSDTQESSAASVPNEAQESKASAAKSNDEKIQPPNAQEKKDAVKNEPASAEKDGLFLGMTKCFAQLMALQSEMNRIKLARNEAIAERDALQAELDDYENSFEERLEAEKAKTEARLERDNEPHKFNKQFHDAQMQQMALNYDRRLRLAANTFEAFLDTLPKKYSAPGYTQLRSIINEANDTLEAIQSKEQKYAATPEMPRAEINAGNNYKTAFWIALSLLLATGIGSAIAWHYWRAAKDKAATTSKHSSSSLNLRRLATMKLETYEDIHNAYASLKDITYDERRYLDAKLLELQLKNLIESE